MHELFFEKKRNKWYYTLTEKFKSEQIWALWLSLYFLKGCLKIAKKQKRNKRTIGVFSDTNVRKNACSVPAGITLYINIPCRPEYFRKVLGKRRECDNTNADAARMFLVIKLKTFGVPVLLGNPFAARKCENDGTRCPKCDIHATVERRTQMTYMTHA